MVYTLILNLLVCLCQTQQRHAAVSARDIAKNSSLAKPCCCIAFVAYRLGRPLYRTSLRLSTGPPTLPNQSSSIDWAAHSTEPVFVYRLGPPLYRTSLRLSTGPPTLPNQSSSIDWAAHSTEPVFVYRLGRPLYRTSLRLSTGPPTLPNQSSSIDWAAHSTEPVFVYRLGRPLYRTSLRVLRVDVPGPIRNDLPEKSILEGKVKGRGALVVASLRRLGRTSEDRLMWRTGWEQVSEEWDEHQKIV